MHHIRSIISNTTLLSTLHSLPAPHPSAMAMSSCVLVELLSVLRISAADWQDTAFVFVFGFVFAFAFALGVVFAGP